MQILVLYGVTTLTFLILDAIMLTLVMKPLFDRHIGALMLENIRLLPAALFYLAYVAGILWFVSWPALRDGDLTRVFINGALLGLMCYGTYEFTSYAIMKDWHWSMVVTDTTWGAVLTALAAWGGVTVTRALAG